MWGNLVSAGRSMDARQGGEGVGLLTIVALAAALIMVFTGCASRGIAKDEYFSRIRRVELAMTKNQFYEVFPEAIPRGAKKYPKGTVEVLEVSYAYYSFMPTGNPNRNALTGMEGQPQWFYFYQDQLIQYGHPEDWPTDPDKIIEIRQR